MLVLESDLRYVPFRAGAPDENVVGHGLKLVNDAAGLAHIQARLHPAEQLSAVVEPVDFTRPVTTVDILGGDLDGPRRAHTSDGLLEVHIVVIDLDAEVAAVADINVTLRVGGDAMRRAELIVAGTVCSNRLLPVAVLVDLDERVSCRSHR